jgi:hypothetical protein
MVDRFHIQSRAKKLLEIVFSWAERGLRGRVVGVI